MHWKDVLFMKYIFLYFFFHFLQIIPASWCELTRDGKHSYPVHKDLRKQDQKSENQRIQAAIWFVWPGITGKWKKVIIACILWCLKNWILDSVPSYLLFDVQGLCFTRICYYLMNKIIMVLLIDDKQVRKFKTGWGSSDSLSSIGRTCYIGFLHQFVFH